MYSHHKKAIETITDKLKARADIQAIIVGGSIAHGFAIESSDLDLMLVLSDEDYKEAIKSGNACYFETEATPYEGGYVDAKYTCVDFIKKVAESGSEPARFAYKDAFITYSKIDGLEQLVKAASRYPSEKGKENMEKFYAQLEAWKWYYYEGLKRKNKYLVDMSVSNYVLFAGRLILAYNKALYPYHKWFFKVLENVKNKPENIITLMDSVLENKTPESVEALYDCIIGFNNWELSEKHWSIRFMLDSELNWMDGNTPVADL